MLEEEVSLDVPTGTTVRSHSGAGRESQIEEDAGRRVYRWSNTNQDRDAEAVEGAQDGLPPADIQASSFESREQIAAWYRGLQGERAQPTEELRLKAQELVAGLTDDRERVAAIHRYVSSDFRYLQLALGVYRYQARFAAEVLSNGYGDCKDKHTLLAALLEAGGFRAEPVPVGALRANLTPEIPSPGQFDHVITTVLVGDERLWLDSTSQVAPFRYLPPNVRGKRGLLVGATGASSGLEEVPEELPFPGEEWFSLEGKVEDDGRLVATAVLELRGDWEFLSRVTFLNTSGPVAQQIAKGFATSLVGKGAQVGEVETSSPTETADPFQLSFGLEVPDYLALTGGAERLDPRMPPLGLPASEGDDPVELFVGSYSRRFSIELPGSAAAEAPSAVDIDREFAAYRSSYEVKGRSVFAERRLLVRVSELPAERLREYEALRRTMTTDAGQRFDVRSDAVRLEESSDVAQLERAAARAARRQEHATAIGLHSRIVELDPGHSTAWNELGEALWESKQHERSLEAFRRQVEADPFHEEAHSWLGRSHRQWGELGRAPGRGADPAGG